MRLIVEVKLKDNTIMNIVADAQNKESARGMAAQLSPRLFADKRLFVYNNTPIVKVEKWSQDKHISYQYGFKKYVVAFMLNSGVQFLQIQAGGVKSAYNNVKVQYGIQENPFMMIYEINQIVKQKSLMESAKAILSDSDKLKEIIKFALDKMVDMPELIPHSNEIKLLIGMVKDYKAGEYKDISPLAIVGITAVLIYLVNPAGMVLDIIPGMSAMDEAELVLWLIKQLAGDIEKYAQWLTNGDDDMIMV